MNLKCKLFSFRIMHNSYELPPKKCLHSGRGATSLCILKFLIKNSGVPFLLKMRIYLHTIFSGQTQKAQLGHFFIGEILFLTSLILNGRSKFTQHSLQLKLYSTWSVQIRNNYSLVY